MRVLTDSRVEHLPDGVWPPDTGVQCGQLQRAANHHSRDLYIGVLKMRGDIDLIPEDLNKAHNTLRSANFHVNGRGTKQKARSRHDTGIIKFGLHRHARSVASIHAEEMGLGFSTLNPKHFLQPLAAMAIPENHAESAPVAID